MTRVRTSTTVAAVSLTTVAAMIAGSGSALADDRGFTTTTKPYLEGVPGSGWTTRPLLTAGDLVPVTDVPGEKYQFVGIPDGLGATTEPARGRVRGDDRDDDDRDGPVRVFVNHELAQEVTTRPYANRPVPQKGAFVDELLLAEDGSVISGRRAYDVEFQDDTQVDTADSPARAFSRFCSGFLGDSRVGLDRPIFFTGEESSGTVTTRADGTSQFTAATFDTARGAQSVAVFTNDEGQREAHALSEFGFFAKENTVIAPDTGRLTVAMVLEDGPQTPDSQLYMYVGQKKRSGTVLERNGLVGGDLYVFAGNDPARNSEATFENGSTTGRWALIPNAETLNDVQTEAAADARGAFGFVRIEDGTFGRDDEFTFVTTGNSADKTINRLGMNYRLTFDTANPLKSTPKLSVIHNADQVDAAGQDTAFSPDNHEAVDRLQAIQEDGTSDSRPEMGERNRDGSVWLVDGGFTSEKPGTFPQRQRIAELTGRTGGRIDPTPRFPGIWESSGIIEVSEEFDREEPFFLLDVQAHESAPPNGVQETREDGQLLFLYRGDDERDDDDRDDDGDDGRRSDD